jgi:hypothetical protein
VVVLPKEDVIKELEQSIYWEDDFVSKYDGEVTWALLREVLSGEKFREVEKLLRENIDDSRRHKKILEDLLKRIRSGEYDV